MMGGALDEVRALMGLGLDPGLPVMRALGVGPLVRHLDGREELSTAVEAAKTETRQFVKRQMTWLKRNMNAWTWLEAQEMENIASKSFAFSDL